MTKADYEACCLFVAPMQTTWRLPAYDILRGQCGGIVGEVEITGCVTESTSPGLWPPFGFRAKNVKPMDFRSIKGRLGFFPVDV